MISQLLSIQLIIQSFYNASIDILAFLAQLFSGSNHIFQTDIKVLTYLAHYLVHNTFHLECCKDLFSLYTTSLSQVITNRNLSHHLYADDTQVYISLSQLNAQESVSTLSDYLTDILLWMESSKLKLNPDKTDIIISGTKQQRDRVINHFPVKLLGSDTFPPDTLLNLGVVFDSDFNFHQHISQVCKSCFHHIRDLRRIRCHISISITKTISKALISSRLDYSLLNNIAKRDLAKLQRVQNCLARMVLRAPQFSLSVPLLITVTLASSFLSN